MNSWPSFRSPVSQWKRPLLKLSAPLIHTLRFVPGVLTAVCACPCASSRSRPSGWSRVWSRSLEERSRLLDHRKDVQEPRPLSLSLCSSEPFSGPSGRGLLQRKPRRWSARRIVSRLTSVARSLNSSTAKSLQLQRDRSHPWEVGDSSSTKRSTYSPVGFPIDALGPRRARSSKAPVHPSPSTKRSRRA
jgi:hypothetical protein